MITNRVNLNHLRIFEAVYRLCGMTHAARELGLTQSGVSQHIQNLEDALGVILFDRLQSKLLPTDPAHRLYQASQRGLEILDQGLSEAGSKEIQLHGIVRLGAPQGVGREVLIPKLAHFLKQNPGVRIEFRFGFAPEMRDLLEQGELDLAVVDGIEPFSNGIRTEVLLNEELELLIPKPFKGLGYDELLEIPYVEYERGSPLINMWFEHHFGRKVRKDLKVRAQVFDVSSILKLVSEGVGAGIVPHHALPLDLSEAPYFLHPGRAKVRLSNSIQMAWLDGRSLNRPSREVREYLRKMYHSAEKKKPFVEATL